MMISPILANGIVAQTQNVSLINNGDESRGQVNYQTTQVVVDEKSQEAHSTVISSQDSNKTDTRHDARDEGKNKYFNNRNTSKKGDQDDSFGAVVKKKSSVSFDISV